MISCVFRVRVMEDEKPCPFDAFTRSHLKGPVIVSLLSSCSTFCVPSHISYLSVPDSQLLSLYVPVRLFSILSACVLIFLIVISNEVSSCEVTALMPIPPRLIGSFILVQSSSSSDLSNNVSQMHFVLASNVSARGFIFLEFPTFASKSRDLAIDFEVMSHRASDFLESKCSCATASTCPANSEASFSHFWASDASCSSAAIEFHQQGV